jgi:hypothetical protein
VVLKENKMEQKLSVFIAAVLLCITQCYAQKMGSSLALNTESPVQINFTNTNRDEAEIALNLPHENLSDFTAEIRNDKDSSVSFQPAVKRLLDLSGYDSGIYILILRRGQTAYAKSLIIDRGERAMRSGKIGRDDLPMVSISDMKLSPNPANTLVNIQLPEQNTGGFALKVISVSGITMIEQVWNGQAVQIASLPPGMYTVTLTKKQKTYAQKLLVTR